MELIFSDYKINGLKEFNILIGKNGCGKSTLLTKIDAHFQSDGKYQIKYITPERGGTLKYAPNVESTIASNPTWIFDTRRKNQFENFKEQSIYQYRKLRDLYYQELDNNMSLRNNPEHTLEKTVIQKINILLENIEIKPTASGIETYKKGTNEIINVANISSGESELISLAIECLAFSREIQGDKENILLLDEPDVHLHPDLQYKFGQFLMEVIKGKSITVIIATHSTAFIGAFSENSDSTIGLITAKQTSITFKSIDETYKRVLPVFGAHPLSNIFNTSPIFIVEGEDDLRIWQQAIRSSNGVLKIYPVDVDGVDHISEYEESITEIINSVYDSPRAYSLRDGDGIKDEIDDTPPITKFRLNCRAAENLILTDEVLDTLGTSWDKLLPNLDKWVKERTDHPKHANMEAFQKSGFDRMDFDLKEIRNILINETGSSKTWEIAVGQTIAKLRLGKVKPDNSANKLTNYLGLKLYKAILR